MTMRTLMCLFKSGMPLDLPDFACCSRKSLARGYLTNRGYLLKLRLNIVKTITSKSLSSGKIASCGKATTELGRFGWITRICANTI